MSRKNLYSLLAVLAIGAMAISACGPAATQAPPAEAPTTIMSRRFKNASQLKPPAKPMFRTQTLPE